MEGSPPVSGTVGVRGETDGVSFSGPSRYFSLSRNSVNDLVPK